MPEITTTIEIDDSADHVWEILTDFERYAEWNPRTRIDGSPTVGSVLEVSPGPDAGRIPTFRPRVLVADGRELRWLGHLYVRGLFDGEHRFTIEELPDDRSRLVHSERFTGLLAGGLLRLIGRDTEAGFEAVNAALRDRAESTADRAAD
ncbi:MAG: SRPBCC domain-containing protein [Haloferacaceae archaeon]